ncbi:hypothetical protein DPB93_18860 [Salmonella enterica subsp. salamae]|nr:hypothetical protein [Salmonella enterica subsp. salamae]ECI4077668.1 hypothetical protein [Salmonella enterica subsp. salamae]
MCGVNLSVFHCIPLVVILVVLTIKKFYFSLLVSQLLAKAIPVRGARFRKACFRAGFLLWVSAIATLRR